MRGRGKGAKETLARKPHDFEKRFFSPLPLPLPFFFAPAITIRYNSTGSTMFFSEKCLYNLEETVPTGKDCYAGYSPSLPNACHAEYVVTA